jgi:hypothetical protein
MNEQKLPAYFKGECHYYMHMGHNLTQVWTNGKSANITSVHLDINDVFGEEITPITRKEYFAELTKAIEIMTGFKFEPYGTFNSDAINHGHANAIEKGLEFVPKGDLHNWADVESDVHMVRFGDRKERISDKMISEAGQFQM